MLHQSKNSEHEEMEECRTGQINAEFSNCLAENKRRRCNHAFLFGDGYLCTHPKHQEFA